MRFVLAAAIKDVRRRLADPAALAVAVAIPLLLGGLLSFVTSRGEVTPRAHVLLVDQDGSVLTALLAGAAARAGGGDAVQLESVTLEDGRRRIDAGDATALLILPKGFQDAVLDQTTATVELITNPAQNILPAIVQEALEIVVEAVFYAQRLFGPSLRRIVANRTGPPSDADVASIGVEINQQLSRLQNVLIPPVIQLEVATTNPEAGPRLNFGQLFLPGMLMMSFLFIAQGISGDVWEEKMRGTLRRALTTPRSAYQLLGGKLLAGLVLMAVVALVALAAAVAMFDVAWARVPIALVWCTFAGAAITALLTMLQTLASTQRGAELLSSLVVFPLMMIGGSFFPFEVMPAGMAAAGRWTPNGLAVVHLKDILFGEIAVLPLLVAMAGIGIPAAAAFLIAGRRLRGRFAAS